MEIVPIFVDSLYAIQYDNEETNEFERLFDLWQEDILFLEEFFEENELRKIERCRSFLREQGFTDIASFRDLEI